MDNLGLDEMKKIAHQIIQSEEEKYNIKIKTFPITFIEYYKDYEKNEKFSLIKKVNLALTPLYASGFNDLKGNTVIFLNDFNKIEKIEGRLFRLLQVCFHEARHSEQQQFNEYSYEGFFSEIDHYIKIATMGIDYILEHDNYSFEIGANLYGVSRAKEYLKENYPNLYEKDKEEIDTLERRYQYDYLMYDASFTLDRFLSIANQLNKIAKLDKKNKVTKKATISPVLDIFFNGPAEVKKVKEIIEHEKFKTLDKRIIYAFFSSKTFLESVDFDKLDEKEFNIIREAIEYTNQVYKNQEKITEEAKNNNTISNLQYLKEQKSIIKKIAFVSNIYQKKVMKFINITRSNTERKRHIDEIEQYANSLGEVKRRVRGFININIFYIIGILIIAISIILYLLLK